MTDNPDLIDELLIVRHSGEIPEVALHGSLYFLTTDRDGPRLRLNARQLDALKRMVVERYREIIQRDLEPGNRDKSIYRGVARALVNWRRMENFCRRENFDTRELQRETAIALEAFLAREVDDVQSKARRSSINCRTEELGEFASLLEIDPETLPEGWRKICRQG